MMSCHVQCRSTAIQPEIAMVMNMILYIFNSMAAMMPTSTTVTCVVLLIAGDFLALGQYFEVGEAAESGETGGNMWCHSSP